jgi:LPS O-antigen subunit length determinant protein (WzzB/FepE family)
MDQRMRDIEKELMVVTANREMASKSVSGQEQVLTLMMLDLQLSRERDKRDELRQEYTLGLAEEADRLVRDEANLQRTLQDREGAIAMIEARIVHLSETRRVNEPLRSQKPVGIGRATIVILAVIIGLMIGLLLVWLRQGLHEHRMTVATT